jgi:hypothetical protein
MEILLFQSLAVRQAHQVARVQRSLPQLQFVLDPLCAAHRQSQLRHALRLKLVIDNPRRHCHHGFPHCHLQAPCQKTIVALYQLLKRIDRVRRQFEPATVVVCPRQPGAVPCVNVLVCVEFCLSSPDDRALSESANPV